MIGQLIYKNVTREGAGRSMNLKIPALPAATAAKVLATTTTTTTAAPAVANTTTTQTTQRQERYLNARFNKNKTKIKKTSPPYKRTHRNVNLEDQFYVSVTPSIFYNDMIAFESEKVPVTPAPHTAITRSTTVSVSAKSASTMARHPTTTTTEHIFTHDMTTIDNLLNDISSKRSNSSNVSMSKVVLVTPRPVRKLNDGKNLLRHNLTDLINAANRTAKQVSRRRPHSTEPPSMAKRGLRFVIANQHDVNSMIAISNDGILMTMKPLDREERDVYHLTIIAEYVQGYVTGAGIYQVVIYVDDVNDNPPVFNLHSYSGSIMENALADTEVTFDQQMLVHDADVGENAIFDLMLQGEGSNLFSIERRNATSDLRNHFTSAYSIGNQRFARTLSQIHAHRNSSYSSDEDYLNIPQYVIRYVGPNVIDREIQSYYEFNVVAKDKGGLSSEVKFTLYVLDANDNAPIFEKLAIFKDASVEVLDYPNDLKVYFVDRSEPDTLTYPIRHHVRNVDHLMTSASNINYEILQLADGAHIGTPRQMGFDLSSAAANATRMTPTSRSRIRRRNFEKPYAVFSIHENVEVGNTVLRLTATDDDYENNAQVSYKIVSQSHTAPRSSAKQMFTTKLFSIDETSGELRVIRPLPAQAEIMLNISAFDSGGLSDTTIIKFKVCITDAFATSVHFHSLIKLNFNLKSCSGKRNERWEIPLVF